MPFTSTAGVVADQFFLLRVDTDHRLARADELAGTVVEVGELAVTIGMRRPLVLLRGCLQAVAHLMQQAPSRAAARSRTRRRPSMLVELGLVEQRYQAVLEVLNDGATVTDVARR